MRRSKADIVLLMLVFFSCVREPASTVFQPSFDAAQRLARQRYGGDLIVLISDGSAACRRVRTEIFGATQFGQFISTNFAAVEVPAGSDVAREIQTRYQAADSGPQIIVASDRLKNLRIHVVRFDRVNRPRLLKRLEAIKHSKTIEDYLQSAGR
jgi:hypothetical protein